MTLPHEDRKIRRLGSLSEYVAAMGEECPKTAWHVGGIIRLQPTETPLTPKELADRLNSHLVARRAAFRSRLCCTEICGFGRKYRYHMEDMGPEFDASDVIAQVDSNSIGPVHSIDSSVTPVEALLESSIQKPFDKSLPPWRVSMVQESVSRNGKALTQTTLVFNLHHVLGDGFTLMNALINTTVAREDAHHAEAHWRPRSMASDILSLKWILFWILMIPVALLKLTYGYLKSDSESPFHPRGKLRGARQVRFCRAIPLDKIKRHCASLHITINDFIIATMAGATRRYLQTEANVSANELGCMRLELAFTANMRQGWKLLSKRSNYSIMLGIPLPIGEAHQLDRVVAVQQSTQQLKRSPLMIGAALSYLAIWACNWPFLRSFTLNRLLGPKYESGRSLHLSNVPGPRSERVLCGHPITAIMGFMNLANGVVAVSYRNELRLTIVTDKKHIDAEVLCKYLEEEATGLLALV